MDWERHFGRFWAERKGRLVYGRGSVADVKATRDLEDILDSLPDEEKLRAERVAPVMFKRYLDEGGDVAKTQHCWAWFVVRFNAILTDALQSARGGMGIAPSEYPEFK